ncbi:MAG: heparinase II/III family protein, partial [Planctomycetota bacterium]
MNAAADDRDESGELLRPEDDSWLEWTSIDDVLEHRPERVDLLLNSLDLDREGLEPVREAVESGDKKAACRALLDYFENEGREEWVYNRLGEPSDKHIEQANDILEGRFFGRGATAEMPEEHGAWDWNYMGPKNNREFAFKLNRHPFFVSLFQAWRKTGEEKYARVFDRLVRDWILHTVYWDDKHQYGFTWRVLEAGLRMRSWTVTFHGFQDSETFTPAARLLMLSSFVEHGRYIKKHHWTGHNHALMEHDGLNRVGLTFPEFKEAEQWHEYAYEQMMKEMDEQVYPDGAHDELSSNYHWVSLSSFENLADITREAGREVPEDYRSRLIDMYDYFVGLVRPNATLPQNQRSDYRDFKGPMLRAAERYDRPDWRYIVTAGEEGSRPEGLPSRFAEWAGHLTSRNGWDEDSLWSCFNVGPTGYPHREHLHFSLTAYGKDFLINSGRFWYMDDKWKEFSRSTRSSNAVLIDGREQELKPKTVDSPLGDHLWSLTEEFDFVEGTHEHYEDMEGDAAHTRAVVFLRDVGAWIVADRISTDRPRSITPMWRFQPERKVAIKDGQTLVTDDDEGANLSIVPAGGPEWDLELIRGQEEPYVQGWYSPRTTEWEPNTCAEYHADIEEDSEFAWIMTPSESEARQPDVEVLESPEGIIRLNISWPNGSERTVTVVLDDSALPLQLDGGRRLQGKVLIETPEESPRVGSGVLLDSEGEIMAEDPVDPGSFLEHMASRLSLEKEGREVGSEREVHEASLTLQNPYCTEPMEYRIESLEGAGDGWSCEIKNAAGAVQPGTTDRIDLSFSFKPGRARYPLPEIAVQLTLPEGQNAEGADGVSEQVSLEAPMVGSRPPIGAEITTAIPDIDGRLDEPIWDREPVIPVFGRMDRERDVEPETKAWLSYDADALYVAFRCEEPDTQKLKREAEERDDNVWKDDSVEILLDPTGDGESYFQVIVNAGATLQDAEKFDADVDLEGLRAATQVEDGEGWTAEV